MAHPGDTDVGSSHSWAFQPRGCWCARPWAPPPRAGPTQQSAHPSARTPPPEQLTGWGTQPGPSADRRPAEPRPAEPSSWAPASGPALQEAGCSLGPASPTRGHTPHMQQFHSRAWIQTKLELKGTCTPMFIALFTTGRPWGQAKRPSPDEWITMSTQAMGCCSRVKKSEGTPFVAKCHDVTRGI